MILSSSDIRSLISKCSKPLIEDFTDIGLQLQPNGFDMCVKSIYKFKNSGEIGFNNSDRRLPLTEEVMPSLWSQILYDVIGSKKYYKLKKGCYLISLQEKVNLPKDVIALTKPRSSIMRSGCYINSAVWDAGYSGRGQVLLTIDNPHGLKLFPNARICQMIFIKATNETEGYNGVYQNEDK